MSTVNLFNIPDRSKHTYHLMQIEIISISENEKKSRGGDMEMKRIRKIVGEENLKVGFLPLKSFSFSRADAAHILFCIFKSLDLNIIKRPIKTLKGWRLHHG